jgi:tetratricopeptide (TPR) repeat protein
MIGMFLLVALAISPAELYNQGNALYNQGKFAEAIAAYRQALELRESHIIHYNLGNAYFKDGQLGRAVIQYRRAWALAPRDADIRHNLEFVRGYRVDKPVHTSGPIERTVCSIFHFFSASEASALAAWLFLATCLLVSLAVVRRSRWIFYAAVVPLLAWVYFLIVVEVWSQERKAGAAAVVAKEVTALSGPGQDYKEILQLHDGTEVNIRERRGDYLLVQLPGGIGGWVPQGSVETIY